jgi:hypothetical protein
MASGLARGLRAACVGAALSGLAASTAAQEGPLFLHPELVDVPTDAGGSNSPLDTADIDGDGHTDVVVVARTDGWPALHVAWGRGDLGFDPVLSLTPVLPAVDDVRIVDMDGDGRLDLLASDTQSFSVWPNLGGRVFGDEQVTPVDPAASVTSLVRAGDLDGDGLLDVLHYGRESGAGPAWLRTFLANGDGTFDHAQSVPSSPLASSGTRLLVRDVDVDGRADVVSTDSLITDRCTEGRLLVYLSQGAGLLAPPLEHCVWNGDALAWDDLDGDRFPDLLMTGHHLTVMQFLRGVGDGTFELLGEVSEILPEPGFIADIADVDGDGLLDLVQSQSGRLMLRRRSGPLTLGPPIVTDTMSILGPRACDLDHDGPLDLVVSVSGRRPAALAGRPDGTWETLGSGMPATLFTLGVQHADIDADGWPDLLNTSAYVAGGPNVVQLRLGRGDGSFEPPLDIESGNNPQDIDVGDLDHDGLLDIVLAGDTGDGLTYTLMQWQPLQFSRPRPAPGGRFSVMLADHNGDGHLDLSSGGFGTVRTRMGQGNGAWMPLRTWPCPQSKALHAADMDLDGDLDLVTTSGVLPGVGDGRFLDLIPFPEADPFADTWSAPGDFDGDGLPDVAVTSQPKGDSWWPVRVHRGVGDGSVAAPALFDGKTQGNTVVETADLDGDGSLDLVTHSVEDNFGAWFGHGDGTFGAPSFHSLVSDPPWVAPHLALGDMNLDGATDVLVTLTSRVDVQLNRRGPWRDLGYGALDGEGHGPRLSAAGGTRPSGRYRLLLRDGPPHAATTLVLGTGALLSPFAGGVLVPTPDALLAGLALDDDGGLVLDGHWPSGLPAGLTLYVQAWITAPDGPPGLVASNALRGDVQP